MSIYQNLKLNNSRTERDFFTNKFYASYRAHRITLNRYLSHHIILHRQKTNVVNNFDNFDDFFDPEVEELESKFLHH